MSGILLAIDPGLRGCGIAIFYPRQGLTYASYIRGSVDLSGVAAWRAMAGAVKRSCLPVDQVVIELPRVYQGQKQRGDPNDLIQVTGVVGMICGLYWDTALAFIYPRDWKGTIPKPAKRADPYVIETRVRERLTIEERKVLTFTNLGPRWDVIDAIGIGLHALGRFSPKKAIAR